MPTQTYNASGFAETIIQEIFGYQPDYLTGNLIHAKNDSRVFNGELFNVGQDGHFYNIKSTSKCLTLEKKKNRNYICPTIFLILILIELF